jgi:predicted membrane-bound dolichyl-phosphate-mannose-protein mannosyltransferase
LETLKKYYNEESPAVKQWIVALSQSLRKEYPEINEKLPL